MKRTDLCNYDACSPSTEICLPCVLRIVPLEFVLIGLEDATSPVISPLAPCRHLIAASVAGIQGLLLGPGHDCCGVGPRSWLLSPLPLGAGHGCFGGGPQSWVLPPLLVG